MVVDKSDIQMALEALEAGEIIGLPTETVYGLAVDATNEAAVEKLYQVKGRDDNKPISIQVPHPGEAWSFVKQNTDAQRLMDIFWPGPLTLVMEHTPGSLAPNLNKTHDTIGVRIPDHTIALEILEGFGRPLAVPSANLTGETPALNASEAYQIFSDSVAVYVEGQSRDTVSSTVLDLSHPPYKLLRAGPITFEDIQHVLSEIEILKSA